MKPDASRDFIRGVGQNTDGADASQRTAAGADARLNASWASDPAPATPSRRVRLAQVVTVETWVALAIMIVVDVCALGIGTFALSLRRSFTTATCVHYWHIRAGDAGAGIGLVAGIVLAPVLVALWRRWKPGTVCVIQLCFLALLLPGQLHAVAHAEHEARRIASGGQFVSPDSTVTLVRDDATGCVVSH